MTLSRSTARVFTGLLSHLQMNEVMAAGLLTHTLRDSERDTPIRISAEVLTTLGTLTEGPIALYGDLKDGVLTVLGPDLRRRTLAAARPRGEMGPPAPQMIAGTIVSLNSLVARTTGKPYIKGTVMLQDGSTQTYLVRGPLADSFAETVTSTDVRLRGVMMGDAIEVLGFEMPKAAAPKRELSRDQKDARNARARARRAKKKQAVTA